MSDPHGRADRPEDGDAWYVYGVVPADADAELFRGLAGIGGGAPALVERDGLAAIVSRAPLAEFEADALATNVRDPVWLETNVRAHEGVLEAALGRMPVVPLRFGTIYRSSDQVCQMLADHRELEDELARVTGKLELGVKGFVGEPPPADAGDDDPALSAGRQYLERKQAARRLAAEAEALRARAANEAHERLKTIAEEAVANPLQAREVSGESGEMFLNGAYLVAEERRQEFVDALAELQAEHGPSGATYVLTGPWPPYNFVGRIG